MISPSHPPTLSPSFSDNQAGVEASSTATMINSD